MYKKNVLYIQITIHVPYHFVSHRPNLYFNLENGLNVVFILLSRGRQYACSCPNSKVHGANMGPIWGRQGPGGHHVGPMNFAIWAHNGGSIPLCEG